MTALIPRPEPKRPVEARVVLEGMVQRPVTVLDNPFASERILWVDEGLTLDEILLLAFPSRGLRSSAVVLLRGVKQTDMSLVPSISDRLELVVTPKKGVGRKIIRNIVQIAVFAVTFVVTGGNVALAQFAAKTLGAYLGNLAANAIIPPSSGNRERIDAAQTYSIEGVRNSARPYQPVTTIWGTHRDYADLMAPFYQEVVGDDIYLVVLLCWAAHPVSLTDLKSGDTLISDFEGVTVQHRLKPGDPEQTLYKGLPVITNLNVALTTGWESRSTAADAEEVEVMLFFGRGLGGQDKKGKPENKSVTIEIRYREKDTGSYRENTAVDAYTGDEIARTISGDSSWTRRLLWAAYQQSALEQYHNNIPNGGVGNVALRRTFTRKDFTPFPVSIKFAVPPGRQYDIEVRRTTGRDDDLAVANDVSWVQLNSWRPGDPAPDKDMAVTALRIKASDQLSGVIDNINAVVTGLHPVLDPPADISLADENSWGGLSGSSNNADVARAVIRGPQTTRPTPNEQIHWPALAGFHAWCVAKEFTFNYVVKNNMRRGELLDLIGTAGRARFLGAEGLLTTVVDGPQPAGPRTIISPVNATDFTFSKLFPPDVDALRVEFPNVDLEYRSDERDIPFPGVDLNDAVNFEPFQIPGVVEDQKVWEHARYFAASSKLMTESGSFTQDFEHLLLRYGDLAALQHDTLDHLTHASWIDGVGLNGSGQIVSIILRDPAVFEAGMNYVIRWRYVGTADGVPTVTADRLEGLSLPPFNGAEHLELSEVNLANPIDASITDAPESGQLAMIGPLGQEMLEVLVSGIEPRGKNRARVSWSLYAPERFDDDGILAPARVPVTAPGVDPRPAMPELVGAESSINGIIIGFNMPDSNQTAVIRFEVSWRETAEAGTDGHTWAARPALDGSATSAVLPAGRPGQAYDVRIYAVSLKGVRSLPLIVENVLSFDGVPAPQNPVVTAGVATNAAGVKLPIVTVSVDAVDPKIIETLIIERRDSGSAAWGAPTTAPADQPTKIITGLTPGVDIDLRLAWRDVRGAVTADAHKVVVSDISVSTEFVAGNTAAVGDRATAAVLQQLDDATDAVADVLANVVPSSVIDQRISDAADTLNSARASADSLLQDGIDETTARLNNLTLTDFGGSSSNLTLENVTDVFSQTLQVLEFVGTSSGGGDIYEWPFEPARVNWTRTGRTQPPTNPGAAYSSDVSFDGEEMIVDGSEQTFFAAMTLPLDASDVDLVYTLRLRFKVDRLHSGGTVGSRIFGLAYALEDDYTDPPTGVSSLGKFINDAPGADGYTDLVWSIGAGAAAVPGVAQYLGSDPQFDAAACTRLRFAFQANFNNGDGAMRLVGAYAHAGVDIPVPSSTATSVIADLKQADADQAVRLNSISYTDASSTVLSLTIEQLATGVASRFQAVEAVADNANTEAGIARSESATARSESAAARLDVKLAAGRGLQAINDDPYFIDYPTTGIPTEYGNYQSAVITRIQNSQGAYIPRIDTPAGVNGGIVQVRNSAPFNGRLPPGDYYMEADVILLAGTLQGAGFGLYARNSSGGAAQTFTHHFYTMEDSSGEVVGSGVVGSTYRFSKKVTITAQSSTRYNYYIFTHEFQGGPQGISQANAIALERMVLRPADSTEAQLTELREVAVDAQNRSNVRFQIVGQTPDGAFIISGDAADDGNGNATSNLLFGAGRIDLVVFDQGGGVTSVVQAVTLEGPDAVFSGGINAAFVRVGTGRLNVAVEPVFAQGSDGDIISYGFTVASEPKISFDVSGLPALAVGESYVVKAVNRTSSQFMLSLKKRAAGGVVSTVSDSGAEAVINVDGGTGLAINKTHNDSSNGKYTFRLRGNLRVQSTENFEIGQDDWFHSGFASINTYFNSGGGYAQGPTIYLNPEDVGLDNAGSSDQTGDYAYDVTRTVDWGNALGVNGTREFAVKLDFASEIGTTVTELVSVTYKNVSGASETSVSEDIEMSIQHYGSS